MDDVILARGYRFAGIHCGIKPDEELDIPALSELLDRVAKEIQGAPNRVRYAMNCFLIAVGGYVKTLTDKAIQTAKKIGKVE